jgi:hypothetical protein
MQAVGDDHPTGERRETQPLQKLRKAQNAMHVKLMPQAGQLLHTTKGRQAII